MYSSLVKSDDISVESNATVCFPKFRYSRKKEKYLHKYTIAQLVWNFNKPHDLSTFVAYHPSRISQLSSAKMHSFYECIHTAFVVYQNDSEIYL